MVSVNLKSLNWRHLIWLVYICLFVFAVPYLLNFVLEASADLFRIVFLIGSASLIIIYRRISGLRIRPSLYSGWALGSILAIFIGLGFVSLSLDGNAGFTETIKNIDVFTIIWRGAAFGIVAGLMVATFPFIVVWRSLAGANPSRPRRFLVMIIAAGSIGLVSFCNNLGLDGFGELNDRGQIEKNIIAALPTLISGNPLAAPIAGAFKSISEIVESGEATRPDTPTKVEIANSPKVNGGTN